MSRGTTYKLVQLVITLSLLSFVFTIKSRIPRHTILPKSENSKKKLTTSPASDTLNFTSGIRSILQDNKDNYWIGSHREGVCKYDGKTFDYFTITDGLADDQVRTIQEDAQGTVWFGTANGVNSYDGTTMVHQTPTPTYLPLFGQQSSYTSLWFNVGNSQGVYQYDGKVLSFLPFTVTKDMNPDYQYAVTGVSRGMDGEVWIATYGALFNYKDGLINVVDDHKFNLQEKDYLHIRSVLADSQGRVWIGNNGIGVLLMEGDQSINFSESLGLIHADSGRNGSKSHNGTLEHVFSIIEDSEGYIWFGDRDTGAWKYDGATMTNYTIDTNLKSQMIWQIYEDRQGDLLFAMADGGVYQYNGESFDRKF